MTAKITIFTINQEKGSCNDCARMVRPTYTDALISVGLKEAGNHVLIIIVVNEVKIWQ